MRPLPGRMYTLDFLQKGKALFLKMQAEYFTEELEVCNFYLCILFLYPVVHLSTYIHTCIWMFVQVV